MRATVGGWRRAWLVWLEDFKHFFGYDEVG
jgi:hypothetical protein